VTKRKDQCDNRIGRNVRENASQNFLSALGRSGLVFDRKGDKPRQLLGERHSLTGGGRSSLEKKSSEKWPMARGKTLAGQETNEDNQQQGGTGPAGERALLLMTERDRNVERAADCAQKEVRRVRKS